MTCKTSDISISIDLTLKAWFDFNEHGKCTVAAEHLCVSIVLLSMLAFRLLFT